MTAEQNMWHLDDAGCLSIFITSPTGERVHAWINRRPFYCDRGHWEFQVAGLHDIDHADQFPRFYVNLERAVLEAEAFLRWRLWKQTTDNVDRHALLPYVARRLDQ